MTADASTSAVEETRPNPAAEIRKTAIKRAWICPGAGFAFTGNGKYALATFVLSLSTLPVVAWVAFRPSPASLWTTIAIFLIATFLCIAEQIAIKRAQLRPPRPAFLVRGFVISSCTAWLAFIVLAALLVTAYGSLLVAGSGMKPTLDEYERLVYHKHVDWQSVKPNAIIVFRNAKNSAWGQPGWLVVGRILAGPGDAVSIQNGNYVVNGTAASQVAGTGNLEVALEVPGLPETLTVPADCYFVVQDSPRGGFDSRVLSWVRTSDVLGSRLWYLSRRSWLKRVE